MPNLSITIRKIFIAVERACYPQAAAALASKQTQATREQLAAALVQVGGSHQANPLRMLRTMLKPLPNFKALLKSLLIRLKERGAGAGG